MKSKLFIIFLLLLSILISFGIHHYRSVDYGKIIVISGISSSGKSSSAQALRTIFAKKNQPYLLLNNDAIIAGFAPQWVNMNPETYNNAQMKEEGLKFETTELDDNPIINLKIGSLIVDTFQATSKALKEFSHKKINVIFEGFFNKQAIDILKKNLKGYPTYFIGLNVSIEEAEKREKERGGFPGMARGQYNEQLNTLDSYDLVVDTTNIDPTEVAKTIYHSIKSKE